jgi:orotidine-5'-phosphate decarboxylase
MYARAFFEEMNFDAVTIAPYMGEDSVRPFLGFQGKWVIMLALTSNPGSQDFQRTPQENGEPLFEKVMRKNNEWASAEEMMYVVGATHAEDFKRIRQIAPEHFLLVPGVGKQGGDLRTLSALGMNDEVGLLVNSSRGILYAGSGEDFADKARLAALKLQQQMADILAERP